MGELGIEKVTVELDYKLVVDRVIGNLTNLDEFHTILGKYVNPGYIYFKPCYSNLAVTSRFYANSQILSLVQRVLWIFLSFFFKDQIIY
jgi:hypothetical protein